MSQQPIVHLDLQIVSIDATPEEIDEMTRQLLTELRDLDLESAELAQGGPVPEGAKAVDPVTLGALTIAVLPTFLPKFLEFVQSWATRGQGRTMKFEGTVAGQAIKFEGSVDDLKKLVAMISPSKAA